MLIETELRILRAVQETNTPISMIASEWRVSARTVSRIAKKYGAVRKDESDSLRADRAS